MKPYLSFAVIASLGLAAGQAPAEGPDGREARRAAAEQASMQFLKELKGELMSAMKDGGPANAIGVCTQIAPAIAGRLSRENGWQVTRVGTRVRNPMLGMPDPWEQEVLKRFAVRQREGEKLDGMAYSEVVQEPEGKYFRYMKAIGVAPQCLSCHGDKEQIPAPVKQVLEKKYPFDRATGYRAGDLRGAVSIKQPLNVKLVQELAN